MRDLGGINPKQAEAELGPLGSDGGDGVPVTDALNFSNKGAGRGGAGGEWEEQEDRCNDGEADSANVHANIASAQARLYSVWPANARAHRLRAERVVRCSPMLDRPHHQQLITSSTRAATSCAKALWLLSSITIASSPSHVKRKLRPGQTFSVGMRV